MNKVERTAQHWTKLSGDNPIDVELIDGSVYGFGTELAVRRLADKLMAGRVGYSSSLGTWFFCNQ